MSIVIGIKSFEKDCLKAAKDVHEKMLAFERDQWEEEQFQSFEEVNDESNQVEYLEVKTRTIKRGDTKVRTELWYGKLKEEVYETKLFTAWVKNSFTKEYQKCV